jgi:ubiquinone biosynthesis protein
MGVLQTSRQIGKTLKNAARLRTIVGVFAKHGFHQILERGKLGQFVLERISASSESERFTTAERVRRSFEELGPTFVKLGQLLASRPDLVPEDWVQEFERLHTQVSPLSFDVIQTVLKEEFGQDLQKYFLEINPKPIGSASIAQVHQATLIDGSQVVLKVQRPGIIQTINDDLSVLYFLAELLENNVPEVKAYSPLSIVDEFFRTLELETNFVVEANNIRRFSENFSSEQDIIIPKVYWDLTTERVLTMQAMDGVPLSKEGSLSQFGVEPQEVMRKGLRAYLKMVFSDGLFHGDLHAGNFFVMPENKIGLIDFGVVGRLNNRTQAAIASMLFALSKEDYERLAYEYIDLAPFNEKVDVDLFAKDLRDLVAPYYGLTLKNVNMGKILLKSASIAAKHHVTVPTELMLYFKSLAAIEGLGRKIDRDFDFLNYSLQFAAELIKLQYEPNKMMQDFAHLARESRSLINQLPRQLSWLMKRINSPDHTNKIEVKEIESLKHGLEISFNLVFLGLIIGCLLISASLVVTHPSENLIAGIPTLSFIGYAGALTLGIVAFFNYIKK